MLAWLWLIASRIWGWLSPRRTTEDFTCELESHLEMLAQENLRRGMTPEEARRAAHVRSEEHTSELQSQSNLVCRLLLEKKNILQDENIPNLTRLTIRHSATLARIRSPFFNKTSRLTSLTALLYFASLSLTRFPRSSKVK